jgi:hypothetical protein
MSGVFRLPVQHKLRPHCPVCKADVPTFDQTMVNISVAELGKFELTAITYHVKCPCGAEWNLRKTVR